MSFSSQTKEKAKTLDPLLDWIHSLTGSRSGRGQASGTSVEDDREGKGEDDRRGEGEDDRGGKSEDRGRRRKQKDGSSITNVEDDRRGGGEEDRQKQKDKTLDPLLDWIPD